MTTTATPDRTLLTAWFDIPSVEQWMADRGQRAVIVGGVPYETSVVSDGITSMGRGTSALGVLWTRYDRPDASPRLAVVGDVLHFTEAGDVHVSALFCCGLRAGDPPRR